MNCIKKFYNSNGYFMPVDVISSNLAKDISLKIENIYKNTYLNILHPWDLQAHLLANWIYDICILPKALDEVEAIIGPNILIQSADIFVKSPKSIKHINWIN